MKDARRARRERERERENSLETLRLNCALPENRHSVVNSKDDFDCDGVPYIPILVFYIVKAWKELFGDIFIIF